MSWTAEITNNPTRGFSLYIELLEDEQYRGRIERRDGRLVLWMYSEAVVPVAFLIPIMKQAEIDLPSVEPDSL